jgi:hypothetical protein
MSNKTLRRLVLLVCTVALVLCFTYVPWEIRTWAFSAQEGWHTVSTGTSYRPISYESPKWDRPQWGRDVATINTGQLAVEVAGIALFAIVALVALRENE